MKSTRKNVKNSSNYSEIFSNIANESVAKHILGILSNRSALENIN